MFKKIKKKEIGLARKMAKRTGIITVQIGSLILNAVKSARKEYEDLKKKR